MNLRPLSSLIALLSLLSLKARAADLRIGLIGLDTSHVIAFTKALNDPKAKDHVPGARVVAVFKGAARTSPPARTVSRASPGTC